MTISEIIEALENAEGPSRWLDAKIDAVLRVGTIKMRQGGYEWAWDNFPIWAHHKEARGMCGVQHGNGGLGLIWDSMEFTASIDAAFSLLPGEEIELTNLYGVARATVHNGSDYGPFYGSHVCNSLPIALCIAALKAIQAKAGANTMTEQKREAELPAVKSETLGQILDAAKKQYREAITRINRATDAEINEAMADLHRKQSKVKTLRPGRQIKEGSNNG